MSTSMSWHFSGFNRRCFRHRFTLFYPLNAKSEPDSPSPPSSLPRGHHRPLTSTRCSALLACPARGIKVGPSKNGIQCSDLITGPNLPSYPSRCVKLQSRPVFSKVTRCTVTWQLLFAWWGGCIRNYIIIIIIIN